MTDSRLDCSERYFEPVKTAIDEARARRGVERLAACRAAVDWIYVVASRFTDEHFEDELARRAGLTDEDRMGLRNYRADLIEAYEVAA